MPGKVKNADPTEFGGPKKVPSGYFAFSNDRRDEVVAQLKKEAAEKGETFSVTAVGKKLGDMWKAADQELRTKYDDAYKAAKEKYDADMKAWKCTEDYKKYLAAQGEVQKQKTNKRMAAEVKAAKPANCPERPMPAYMVFSMEVASKVAEEAKANGDASMKARSAIVKAKWEALPEEEKKKREEDYQAKKAKYAEDMKAFEETEEYKTWEKLKEKQKKQKANNAKALKNKIKTAGQEEEEAAGEEPAAEAEEEEAEASSPEDATGETGEGESGETAEASPEETA